MSDVAAAAHRARFPWRLRLLVVVAVLVSGFTVFAVIETLHFSSTANTQAMDQGGSVGFFTPKSTKPVPFSLPELAGAGKRSYTSQADLLGKPVVLNLWASSCTVCRSEMPAIESVARTLGGRVRFVGVDSADERGAARAFVRRYGVTYTQLFDPKAVVATGYGIPGLPVTVFVTPAGKVVGENIGALSATSLRHYLGVLFQL